MPYAVDAAAAAPEAAVPEAPPPAQPASVEEAPYREAGQMIRTSDVGLESDGHLLDLPRPPVRLETGLRENWQVHSPSSFNSPSIDIQRSLNESSSLHIIMMEEEKASGTPLGRRAHSTQDVKRIRFIEVIVDCDTTDGDGHCGRHLLLPATTELLHSPVLRKIGELSFSDPCVLECRCSGQLLESLQAVAGPVRCPAEFSRAWFGFDFLLCRLPAFAVQTLLRPLVHPLMRQPIIIPDSALLCEQYNTRSILDVSFAALSEKNPRLASVMRAAGYDAGKSSRVRAAASAAKGIDKTMSVVHDVPATLQSAQEECVLETMLKCLEYVCSYLDVSAAHSLRCEDASSIPYTQGTTDSCELSALACDGLMSLPDFRGGAELVLRNAENLLTIASSELVRWMHWRSIRCLYIQEMWAVTGEDVPNISLSTVRIMQRNFQKGIIGLSDFLPFGRDMSRRIPLLDDAKPSSLLAPCSALETKQRAISRVPWLRTVWDKHPDASLTGSLLMEILGSGSCHTASDTDLFATSGQGADELCTTVSALMAQLGGVVEIETKGNHRYTITTRCCDSEGVCDSASLQCDVYVNSIAQVTRYHLPMVRCALSHDTLFIAPSCAIALATRVCIDYQYFASAKKTPYEIITKKRAAGYNFVVNGREFLQLNCFGETAQSKSASIDAEGRTCTFVRLCDFTKINDAYACRRLPPLMT